MDNNINIKTKNKNIVKNLNPQNVFNFFAEIGSIPRGSGNTDAIAKYLINFAMENHLEYKKDEHNNVIIIKRSKNPLKSPIGLQGHIDMVCAKTKNSLKDMKKEGVEILLDEKFLFAKDTSLGADDGIGVAISLAILADTKDYGRDIYGIFTTDEETSMVGASSIDLSDVRVNNLINIDNEEYDVINVGCASGTQVEYKKVFNLIENKNKNKLDIEVNGCFGGHSGIEITREGANAIKILAEILFNISKKYKINLININGGEVENAIPISADVSILIDSENKENILKEIDDIAFEIKEKYKKTDPKLNVATKCEDVEEILSYSEKDTNQLLEMLTELPNGLISMFVGFDNVAETSLNLGVIRTEKDAISFKYLVRSNINNKRDSLVSEIRKITKDNGFTEVYESSFPAWEYEKDTELENEVLNAYKKLYNEKPKVEITHGGLECGILKQKLVDTHFIAVGPNIFGIHTVKEKLEIETVKKIYNIILEVIKNIY